MKDKEFYILLTRKLGIEVIKLTTIFPFTLQSKIIAKQIIKSATSVGANYRSACRARSKADFIAKLGIVEKETDETLHWLDVIIDANILKFEQIAPIRQLAERILAFIVKSLKTAKNNPNKRESSNSAYGILHSASDIKKT